MNQRMYKLDCNEVMKQMKMRNWGISRLSREADLALSTVCNAIRGNICSRKTVNRISNALDMSVDKYVTEVYKDSLSVSTVDSSGKQREPLTRKEVLKRAAEAVCGERDQLYRKPENNFRLISNLWSEYMGKECIFSPVDVAMMMVLLKISRVKSGTATDDSFVDIAGYAACGAEVKESELSQQDFNFISKKSEGAEHE